MIPLDVWSSLFRMGGKGEGWCPSNQPPPACPFCSSQYYSWINVCTRRPWGFPPWISINLSAGVREPCMAHFPVPEEVEASTSFRHLAGDVDGPGEICKDLDFEELTAISLCWFRGPCAQFCWIWKSTVISFVLAVFQSRLLISHHCLKCWNSCW